MSHRLQGKRRIILPVVIVLLLLTASSAWAQHLRPEGAVFVRPKVGLSNYMGDNEKSPLNFNGDAFRTGFPWGVGVELGYQIYVPFSVSVAFVQGEYPVITQFPPPPARSDDDVSEDPSSRTSIQLIGRLSTSDATKRVAPYFNFGFSYSFGAATQDTPPDFATEEDVSAYGPVLGVGLDIALNPRTSFFLEANSGIHFGDDQLDANADNGFGGVDLLSTLAVGFKVSFRKAITPVTMVSAICPAMDLIPGQQGDFSVMVNDTATDPVTIIWKFGDGSEGSGASVTHSYASAGTYNVVVAAQNKGGGDTSICTAVVKDPAEIVTVTANKTTVSICDGDPSVTFSANVRGDAPLTYSWDFGDGAVSSMVSPTHTYESVGTYTVTLTLSNQGGSDTRSMSVEVTEAGCFNCDISQMNSAFFNRNSSDIMPEALSNLEENLEILQNCTLNARVEGYASRDERRTQLLSEDRARAVMQYYIDHGIEADRITSVGMGAAGQTTKNGGASQFRRADTIPLM